VDDDLDRWEHFYYDIGWRLLETQWTTDSEDTEAPESLRVYSH